MRPSAHPRIDPLVNLLFLRFSRHLGVRVRDLDAELLCSLLWKSSAPPASEPVIFSGKSPDLPTW